MSALPSPRAILIDLDDTLIGDALHAESCWIPVCERHAPALGVDPAVLMDALERTRSWYWSDPERHRRGRLDLQHARAEVVTMGLAELGIDGDDGGERAVAMAAEHQQLRHERTDLLPDTVATLRELRARGHALALITNGEAEPQRAKIERFALAPYFDAILVEGELEWGKPDERVYHHALELLGAQPHETWMVGDNLVWEIEVPQRLGIRGIWIDPVGRGLPDGTTIRPDRIIRRLSELLEHDER